MEAWRRDFRDAARSVRRVTLDEAMTRRVDGPRGTVAVETRGTLTLDAPDRGGGPAGRVLRSATVDGRAVEPERVAELDRRLVRAFGGSEEAARPPRLLPPALDRGEPVGLDLDTVDGQPAWRVSLRVPPGGPPGGARGGPRGRARHGGDAPPDRASAWFSRSTDAPRLLRLRTEGERPGGGAFVRTVDYRRTDGLDLPAAMSARVEVRQRRRLRVYATSVAADARYSRPVVGR